MKPKPVSPNTLDFQPYTSGLQKRKYTHVHTHTHTGNSLIVSSFELLTQIF